MITTHYSEFDKFRGWFKGFLIYVLFSIIGAIGHYILTPRFGKVVGVIFSLVLIIAIIAIIVVYNIKDKPDGNSENITASRKDVW